MVFDAIRRSLRNTFRRKKRKYDQDVVDGKNLMKCKVALLDGTDIAVNVRKQAYGKDLMSRVFIHLDLVEKDYFGLQYMDINQVPHWLDPTKKVKKQVRIGPPFTLHFRVKFYAVDPHTLKEELTRYHYFLQLKADVREGKLHPTSKQAIELGAFAVQSELGDHDNTIHTGNYISEFRLVKDQNEELERAIEKKHRTLAGMNPAECEIKYLNIARDLEYYGMDRHEVRGEDGKTCIVGLTPTGIMVMKGGHKLGSHHWNNITNITFKQSRFILCAKTNENEHEEYRFELESARASKHLWKCAIEYHSFFRLIGPADVPERNKPGFLSSGSRFRYSGRTLHQATQDDKVNSRSNMMFKRTRSERFAQRSTIGYIRIGSSVWAKAVNGDYYKGTVTAMTDKVHVKFDSGDTIAHEKSTTEGKDIDVVYDMNPNANELKIGTKVIAHWSGVSAFLPGTISKIEGNKYYVLYEDGDKGTNRLEQMRILKPPLYFGPGSGRSNLQKKYSMKTTILSGKAGATTADGPSTIRVDVNRPNEQKPSSTRQKKAEGNTETSMPPVNHQREDSHVSHTSHTSRVSNNSQTTNISNGGSTQKWDASVEKTNNSQRHSSKSGSGKKPKPNKPVQTNPSENKGPNRETPALNARLVKHPDTGNSYQITDL